MRRKRPTLNDMDALTRVVGVWRLRSERLQKERDDAMAKLAQAERDLKQILDASEKIEPLLATVEHSVRGMEALEKVRKSAEVRGAVSGSATDFILSALETAEAKARSLESELLNLKRDADGRKALASNAPPLPWVQTSVDVDRLCYWLRGAGYEGDVIVAIYRWATKDYSNAMPQWMLERIKAIKEPEVNV